MKKTHRHRWKRIVPHFGGFREICCGTLRCLVWAEAVRNGAGNAPRIAQWDGLVMSVEWCLCGCLRLRVEGCRTPIIIHNLKTE